MNRVAGRAWVVLLLVFALVAGMCFFLGEYASKAMDWAYFDGSPHVYDGGRLGAGAILDRDGKLILTLAQPRVYSREEALRRGFLHWVGDREGNISAPILGSYTREMTGYDFLNGFYSYGNRGGQMRLTLSAGIQTAALAALGDAKGTVAVYNYKTGELLCAVSTPGFDPDRVPDIAGDTTGAYDGVYLNRFTQATYTPGSIFKLVTAAAALETLPDILDRSFYCPGEVEVDGGTVSCETAHGVLDLQGALACSCNCAFAEISQLVGREKLNRYADTFGITGSVSFDGIVTEPGSVEILDTTLYQLAWSGIGQHRDLVNPCGYLTFVGAIANGGQGVAPHVVRDIYTDGTVVYEARPQQLDRIMSRSTAEALQQMMRNNVEVKYGVENFPDLTVCAKSGTAEMDGDVVSNALFTGFVADDKCPLAFIVVVQEGGYGSHTGIPIVNQVLLACMEELKIR